MAQSRSIRSLEIEEDLHFVASKITTFRDALPENNYWGFSTYTIIAPFILKELRYAFKLPQNSHVGPLWNYLDGACSIVVGGSQLMDDENHRQFATKLKGIINVCSGVGLISLTAISFSMFGGPGFAAAFGIGFALSLDETIRHARRLTNDEYWLSNSIDQVKKFNELIHVLNIQITTMKKLLPKNNSGTISNWALNQMEERLRQYKKNKKEIEEDIIVRVKTMRSRANAGLNERISSMVEDGIAQQTILYDAAGVFVERLRSVLRTDIRELREECISGDHQEKEYRIRQKCKDALLESSVDSLIWGIAFTGMLLACIPGMQIPALLVIAAASAIYVGKNTERVVSFFESCYSYFFHKKIDSREKIEEKECKLGLSL